MKASSFKYFGTSLGLVATAFCFWYLYKQADIHWQSLSDLENIHLDTRWLYVSLVIYLFSSIMAGIVWFFSLRVVGDNTPQRHILRISLLSQIAKYIPGNLAHLLGKAMLAFKAGCSASKVSASIVIELSYTVLVAVFITLLAVMLEPAIAYMLMSSLGALMNIEIELAHIRYGAIALLVLGGSIFFFFSRRVIRLIKIPIQQLNTEKLYYVFLVQLFNIILFGLSFAVAAHATLISNDTSLALIVGASTVAWLAGFLALGAPGGLGVREAVLVVLLAPEWGVENVMIISVIHRLLTVGGDLLAFVLGFLLKLRFK